MDEKQKQIEAENAILRQAAKIIKARMDEDVPTNGEEKQTVTVNSFGTFTRRIRNACTRINPKTGDKVAVPAKHVISFKASPSWLREMNQ